MAILLKFYSVIIPLKNLEKILNEEELEKIITTAKKGGRFHFDGEIYCEQTMNPADNEMIIKFWEEKGLTPKEIINGKEHWKDLCIIEFPNEEPTLPCQWIKIFQQGNDLFAKMK